MKKALVTLLVFFISVHSFSQNKPFWDEIKAFREQDSIQKPQDGMILFIGSSSFRLWRTANEDFNNDTILNRAFGGATLLDVINYKDDVVLKYKPKKIFIYCGENDIASSEKVGGKTVFKRFKILYKTLRSHFPETSIVFVSIKPSPLRWVMKDRMMDANVLISEYLSNKKKYCFCVCLG